MPSYAATAATVTERERMPTESPTIPAAHTTLRAAEAFRQGVGEPNSFRQFINEAKRAARLDLSGRLSISVIGIDGPGHIRDVTEKLHGLGCNVEAASGVVLAGQLALTVVVSGNERMTVESVRRALVPLQQSRHLRIAVMPGGTGFADETRLRGTLWKLQAQFRDRRGALHEIAALLAEYSCQIVSLTTRVVSSESDGETSVFRLDFVAPDMANPGELVHRIRASMQGWGATPDDWALRPGDIPLPALLREPDANELRGALGLTVVDGESTALVEHLTRRLAEHGFNLVASTMGVLEGRTLMILMLQPPEGSGAKELTAVVDTLRELSPMQSAICELDTATSPHPRSGVHHHFYGLTAEHPGVIAALTKVLAAYGANVVALSARVIGHTAACVVHVDCFVPSDRADALGEALAAFANEIDWDDWDWCIGPPDTDHDY